MGDANAIMGPPERKWLWWSAPESAERGTPTVLAIAETICAMGLAGYLLYRTGVWEWLAIAGAVAPVLLLRTPESTRRGLLWVQTAMALASQHYPSWAQIDLDPDPPGPVARRLGCLMFPIVMVGFVALLLLTAAFGQLAKISALLCTFAQHPIRSLASIPGNWWRAVGAIDFHHPLEMVPGAALASRSDPETDQDLVLSNWWTMFRESAREESATEVVVTATPLFPFLLVCFLPALIYRWSLKATSFVWAPLAWAVVVSRQRKATARQRIEYIRKDATERLLWWYAVFTIVFLTALPLLLALQLRPVITQYPTWTPLANFWLFTGELKAWHVARTISAAGTILLYLAADRAYRASKFDRPWPDGLIHYTFGGFLFLRSLIGVLLAAKALHIVWTMVDWSSVDWKWRWW